MSATLLPFPPPYRAALALSNDIDDALDPAGWFRFLRYLNTADSSAWGQGLNLEAGDSFWMWSDDPQGQPGSFFTGLSETPSSFAPYIRALGRAGFLDTLHSYGNFSRHGGFRRDMAETALRTMEVEGLSPEVWVNHGGVHDFQNLAVGCGDLPENPEATDGPCPEYHLDLTRKAGFRFAWVGELTRVPGQHRGWSYADGFDADVWSDLGGRLRRRIAGKLAYRDVLHRIPDYAAHRNRLLTPRLMGDGSTMTTFVRTGDFRRASFADLGWLLRARFLDDLEYRGGYSVVFVHWCRHPGRSFEVLPQAGLAGLRDLSRRFHEGRIWVTTTARLLRHAWVRDQATLIERETGGSTEIEIRLPDASATMDMLQGQAVRVSHAQGTALLFRGQPVPVETRGGDVLVVPSTPLVFPDEPGA